MTLGTVFITSLVIGFSGAITPGPLFVACVTRTARDGFRGGWFVTVGHALLELVVVLALTLGLGAFLVRPGVAPSIGLAGGLVLVWMGYGTVKGAGRGEMVLPSVEHDGSRPAALNTPNGRGDMTGDAAAPVRSPASPAGGDRLGAALGAVATGLAATVSGPYWIIWWATVGLSYITLAAPLGTAGTAAFYLGHVLSDFVWYSAVAAAVAGGRRLLTARGYRVLLVACGVLLLALGIFFAAKGVSTLAGLV